MPSQYTVGVDEVTVDDAFWSPWIDRNRDVTVEYQYEQLEESGTLENFRRAIDGKSGGFQGMWFQDTDAYKWIEAASYELAKADDPDLRERVDEVIDLVARAQEESGYLDTYFQLVEPENRWTNLNIMHELYCAGHLIEAAVAHHEATGERSLLDVAVAFADHVDDIFGDEIDGVPGHEGIELALVRLYRVTDEERYLDLAAYFVDLRGHDDRLAWELDNSEEIGGASWDDGALVPAEGGGSLFLDDEGEYVGTYAQAQAPVREQEAVEGHSVRAMYLYAGVTDLVAERGDEELRAALDRLWTNMTEKRMYVTGGIGSAHEHEGFTDDYDLPNESAYAETCAAVGSVFWNQRLFELEPDPAYADLIERTLYNGFLAGVGMDGEAFFYVNPLASDGDHHRSGWFTCACCPPNAARLFASLGQYCYSTTGGELYVAQYVGGSLSTTVDGTSVELDQESDLPWDGEVAVDVDADGPVAVNFRIPEWATEATVAVDGEDVSHDGSGFVRVEREWDGERVELTFGMEPELVAAHPSVEADAGRVAVERGPLVYCAEAVDNERPLHQYAVDDDATVRAAGEADALDGVTVLEADATVPALDGWDGELYRPVGETEREESDLELVPYYAWDNRESGAMAVWHRRT
ncbi:glycoside hydrolase family 127 protein [Halosimplex rubrum]|uniref:Glycoside hydrolase family 127 protein n=1 Tax=Halosimplex rubrum TaxID=869889 RepID=A0A7D5P5M9_9EURY|nr:beta-L-arabinofuranosidase domain-containing protein [Halosimplex rubrum]QLH79781.1 glycoside hydrolase family 127 protein [Halosimplex rubrum]